MGNVREAIIFFDDEIFNFGIQLNGVLSDAYRNYINRKKQIYNLAKQSIISSRLSKIENGALFGEYSVYDDSIFPYKLINIINHENGDMIVMDISKPNKPVFQVNVSEVFIEGDNI